ncbi:MAG: hypothetical protein ABIK68_13775 [bacterium]
MKEQVLIQTLEIDMITRKIFPFLVAAFLSLSFSSSAQAEFFSISAGVPVSHNLSNSNLESDGVSGYLVHFKLPIMIGLGMESYETKIKYSDPSVSDMKLATNMVDIFWLTPIPVINVTLGAGAGTADLSCSVAGGTTCSNYYDKGTVTQLWAQLGISPIPFLDVHVSYHSVSGDVKGKGSNSDLNVGGTVIAVGASIIF